MNRKSSLFLTRGATVAALYVILTYFSALFGLASGAVQLRLSEILAVLPIFMPEAVIGLTVGCIIANILTGAVVWDVIFGALATLIGAIFARILRRLPNRFIWIATLPTVFSNALIIPFVLSFAYGAVGSYFYFFLTVAFGEIICATILGTLFYFTIAKTKLFINTR